MLKSLITIFILSCSLLSLDLTFGSKNAQAQNETSTLSPEERTQNISDTIMSPFCPGRTLSACPSEDARSLRSHLSGLISEGYSDEAIKRQLVSKYGVTITGLPDSSFFGKLATLAPSIFLALGMIVLVLSLGLLKRRKRLAPDNPEEDLSSIENLINRSSEKKNV